MADIKKFFGMFQKRNKEASETVRYLPESVNGECVLIPQAEANTYQYVASNGLPVAYRRSQDLNDRTEQLANINDIVRGVLSNGWLKVTHLGRPGAPPGGAPVQTAASAPAAPDAGDLPRAAWYVSEALRLDGQARDLDAKGSSAEAIFQYRRTVGKLECAISACPKDHPDSVALTTYMQDLSLRLIYLESLGGVAPTQPPEDHLAEELAGMITMDLSVAALPADQEVSQLVARGGVDGASAELSSDGLQVVAALRDEREMALFIGRACKSWSLELREEASSQELVRLAKASLEDAVKGGDSYSRLEAQCRACGGFRDVAAEERAAEAERQRIEADRQRIEAEAAAAAEAERQRLAAEEAAKAAALARKELEKDKLQFAIVLEKEARELEAQGRLPEALHKYVTCTHAFSYVLKFDQRAKSNDKVRDTVRQRLEVVVTKCEEMKANGVQAPAVAVATA